MAIKLHELAKELGATSKELLERAKKLGIEVKSHMSTLTEKDIAQIKGDFSAEKASGENRSAAKSVPGAPPFVVAGAPPFVAAGAPPFAADVVSSSKPIVDESYFEEKQRKKDEAEGKLKAEEDEPLKQENSKGEDREVNKEATAEENKKDHTEEQKTSQKEEGTVKAEPKTETNAEAEENAEEAKEDKAAEVKTVAPLVDSEEKQADKKPDSEKKHESETKKEIQEEKPSRKYDRKPVQELKIVERASDRVREEKKAEPKHAVQDKKDKEERRESKKDFRRDSQEKREKKTGNEGRFPVREKNVEPELPKSQDRRQRGGDSMRQEGKSGQGKRVDKKSKQYENNKHNKYDKLERMSLEKQSKGKHAKYKVVEPEPIIEEEPLPEGTVVINVPITVAGFCEQAEVSTSRVIMTLMKLGIMANINQNIDEETVLVLADDLGINVHIGRVEEETEEEGLELFEDKESDLKPRPPIITVMGHVDHGKTSLLDAIRKTNVTALESGGITQHIGASEVEINGQKIVFLDTPGHEAFTAMRARGAHVTDIAVLVVAADDGVMPQTVESISHAKAAGVPIIVAVNKMDKPGANPDRVKQELSEHGVLVEEWGGDVITVPVSAKTGDGIVNLLEMILLQAEVLELKANPNRLAMGTVIEARLDKAKGPVATLLVTNGTLQSGQSIVAGTCAGRIRLMTDDKGKTIKKAGPATAVEILGLTEVPQAGDEFNAVKEDKIARDIAERRREKLREEVLAKKSSMSLEKFFNQMQEGETKELNLIIKGDVQGSIGAIVASLEKLNTSEVRVNIIHTGVGTVTESDVMLAGTSNAVIIGFNVRPSTAVQSMADRDSVEIRSYRVIYDVIDDVENAMKGMLDPEFKEEILGKVEIRNTFKVPNVGIIGGAYVTEGKVQRNAEVRLVRDGIVIHEGKISSLKRFKDDAKEVAQGYECGIGIENYNDIKEGDIIECFHMVEVARV